MRNLKYCVLTLALVAIVPVMGMAVSAQQPTPPAPQTTQTSAVDPELQKLADAYSAAWAKGDAAAIAAMYTADAMYVDSGNVLMKGRSEIEATFKLRFAGELKNTKIAVSPGQFRQLGPDVRIGEGAWLISGVTAPDSAATTQPRVSGAAASAGRYLNTFVREQGRWMIAGTAAVPEPPKVP